MKIKHSNRNSKKSKKKIEHIERSPIAKTKINSIIKNRLKATLSSNQLDVILNVRKRVKWSLDEISAALTLRYFSKRAYKYLARDLKYPLPSISTLQRHARTFNLKQGVLEDVINMIGNFTRTFEKQDKECVLSFDEMKVSEVMEYDIAADEIMGPFNYVQVVMARGLFQKWKQPVYIGFDQKMTKEIVNTLIEKLYHKGVNVVSIVSDNASTNISCWKELGVVSYNEPFFKHPVTNTRVYVIPDAPHLLKLMRNWLLKPGFEYNGHKIQSDILWDLVSERDNLEITSTFKLTKGHILLTSLEKQNVRKAAELLSRTTAVALRHYYPHNENAINLANVIEKIDLWFNISNSCSPVAKLDYKKTFTGNENQISALDEMHEFL